MLMFFKKTAKLTSFYLAFVSVGAAASDMRYQPINPSFGGSPLNSSHLLAIANAQNDYKAPVATSSSSGSGSSSSGTPQTAAQRQAAMFLSQIESRLVSQLAYQVTEAIFGQNPANSGRVVFGTQTVSFNRGLDTVSITLFDAESNSTTNISVPLFVPGN